MLIVALTGGIASGKSVIADVFRSRGAVIDSADASARELMVPGRPGWEAVVARLGPAILGADRMIDRRKLAEILFRDPEVRSFLDAAIHPLVQNARRETVARLEREGRTKIYVAESALIFEAGVAGFFDRIVAASCDDSVRAARLAARDGLEPEEAARRLRAQLPDADKRRRADYVIDTSGPLEETLAGAERVYARLVEDAARKDRGEPLDPLSAR
jgi:dephospho-CoA kinase